MKPESAASGRVLDPLERTSEVLFGVIMVLSFTGSLSAATSGEGEVRTVLAAAVGCNLAWGLVDAVMYIVSGVVGRSRKRALLLRLEKSGTEAERREILVEEIPPVVVSAMNTADIDTLASNLAKVRIPGSHVSIPFRDLRGAVGVFLLVFLSTFPVALPFLFLDDLHQAMRWSNGIAVVLMFLSGYSLGRYAGLSGLLAGSSMAGLGIILVAITIALGG